MIGPDTRSLPELVADMVGDMTDLVRKESQLVRAEVTEKIQDATRAGGMLAVGGALLLGAFLVLLQALVLALSKAMDPLWASIIVGVVVGLVGYSFIKRAMKKVQPSELTPDRSARQIRKDVGLVKEQAR